MSRIIDRPVGANVSATATFTSGEAIQVGDVVGIAEDGKVYWLDDPNNPALTGNVVTRAMNRSAASYQTVAVSPFTVSSATTSTMTKEVDGVGGLNRIMTLANGNVLLVNETGGSTIAAAIYSQSGVLANSVTVTSTYSGSGAFFACDQLSNGNIVVVWTDSGTSTIRGAVYDTSLSVVVSAATVSGASYSTSGSANGRMVALSGGGFAMVYQNSSSVPQVIIRSNTLTVQTAEFAVGSTAMAGGHGSLHMMRWNTTGFAVIFPTFDGSATYWGNGYFYTSSGSITQSYVHTTTGWRFNNSNNSSGTMYAYPSGTGVIVLIANPSSTATAVGLYNSSGVSGGNWSLGASVTPTAVTTANDGAFWFSASTTLYRLASTGATTTAIPTIYSLYLQPDPFTSSSIVMTYATPSGPLFYSGTVSSSMTLTGFSTPLFTETQNPSYLFSAVIPNCNGGPFSGVAFIFNSSSSVRLAYVYERLPLISAVGIATTSTSGTGQSITVQYSGNATTRLTFKLPIRADYRSSTIPGDWFNIIGNKASLNGLT